MKFINSARRSASAELRITVTDLNDLAPICQSPPVAVVVFPWTGSPIATLRCTEDEDTVNGEMMFIIVGGDPDGVFQVSGITVRVVFMSSGSSKIIVSSYCSGSDGFVAVVVWFGFFFFLNGDSGRPRRRWQDGITEKEGTTWIRKATDRRQWKTLMEGYILQ